MAYRWPLKPKFLVILPLLLTLLTAVACGADKPTPQPTATPLNVQDIVQSAVASALEGQQAGATTEDVASAVASALEGQQAGATTEDVASAIAKALAEQPGVTTQDVAAEIAKALKAQPGGVTSEEMASAIASALAGRPGVTTQDVAAEIAKVLEAQPGVTEEQVAKAIENALKAQPGVTSEEVAMAIENALKAQPGISQEDIQKAVEEAVAKALPTATPAPPGIANPEAKYGGIIPMSRNTQPVPGVIWQTGFSVAEYGPVYNQLIEFNPETSFPGALRGDLAKTWELAEDGITYTFHLNEKARWWDGEPVTAEDVVFSFTAMVDPQSFEIMKDLNAKRKGVPFFYESSRVINDTTVEIKTKSPSAGFINAVAHDTTKIIPKHVVIDQGKLQDFKNLDNVMGSGPFKVAKWNQDVSVEYEANRDYFKDGLPYTNGETHFYLKDKGTTIAAFQTGGVLMQTDNFNGLSNAEADQLDKDMGDRLTVYWTGPAISWHFMLNTTAPPFDDARVRRAMTLALHRQPLLDIFGAGRNVLGLPLPIGSWFGRTPEEAAQVPGFRELDGKKHPDDIAAAKSLLAEAGVPDGVEVTISMFNAGDRPDVGAVLAEQLKEFLNMEVTIQPVEFAAGIAQASAGDFQAWILLAIADPLDPDGNFELHLGTTGGRWMAGGNKFPDAEPWVVKGVPELIAKQTSEVTDQEKRLAILREIEELILTTDNALLGLFQQMVSYPVEHRIKNYFAPTVIETFQKHETIWCDPKC